jgi:lysozyme family protein
MPSFDAAISYVLENEGGESDNPADHGGATRYGITHDEAAAHGIDIAELTLVAAKTIYLSEYWNPNHFGGIGNPRVATKLFDMAVNMGAATAIRIAQRALGVVADGVMGPETLNAINNSTPDLLLFKLASGSVRRYVAIVMANHSQLVFLSGWVERGLKVPA